MYNMQNCLFWGRAVGEVLTNLNEWQKSVNADLLFGLKCCIFVLTYRKPCGFLFLYPFSCAEKPHFFAFLVSTQFFLGLYEEKFGVYYEFFCAAEGSLCAVCFFASGVFGFAES